MALGTNVDTSADSDDDPFRWLPALEDALGEEDMAGLESVN